MLSTVLVTYPAVVYEVDVLGIVTEFNAVQAPALETAPLIRRALSRMIATALLDLDGVPNEHDNLSK